MSSHSALLVLTHIQAWEDPCETLRHLQVSRKNLQEPLSKGKRNRELDSETKHFQQDRARYCQEIEELRRICCAEAERARKLNDAREFYDPEAASSSGGSHVPSQPLSVPSPRGNTSRDSWSQLDTRKSLGTSGHVF